MKITLLSLVMVFSSVLCAFSQDDEKTTTIMLDHVRFEGKSFSVDEDSNTATVELFLTSTKATARELKINVYGTQIVDSEETAFPFSKIQLGRVTIQFEDRQNYMHYLLQPDTPVKLLITVADFPQDENRIHSVKVLFEDSTEMGKFIEAYVNDIPLIEK